MFNDCFGILEGKDPQWKGMCVNIIEPISREIFLNMHAEPNVIFEWLWYDSIDKEHIMIARFSEPEKFMNLSTFTVASFYINFEWKLKCWHLIVCLLSFITFFIWITLRRFQSLFLYSIYIHLKRIFFLRRKVVILC